MDIFRTLRPLRSLNKYLWRYRRYLLWGAAFVIISNFFAVVPAQMVRKAFDLLSQDLQSVSDEAAVRGIVLRYAGLILLMAVLKGFFMYVMRQTLVVMSRHIEYDQKNDIYAHLQKLSLAFYRRNNTGDLMARISEDVSRVRMYVGPSIMYLINLSSLIILTVIIMFSVSVKLTLCVLAPLPILAVSIYYVNSITFARSTAIQQQLSRMTTFVQEVFSGIRVIKSFSAAPGVRQHFSEEVQAYRDRAMSQVRVEAFFFPLILLLIGLSTLLTLYVGGREVIAGRLSPGVIAEFFIYVNLLSWPFASLGWTSSLIQRAAASQARINELLDQEPEVVSTINDPILVKGKIEFRNVSFTYPDTGIHALKHISFDLKAGESLGIIGRTGSGKSTISRLLLRDYDVTDGQIIIDGKDIRALDLSSYRSQVGYVPQDDFLFAETIAHNILFSSHAVARFIDPRSENEKRERDALLEWAAGKADVHKDIKDFPKGFETFVGERGITLSGGQKQRVAIARAIVTDPRILLLDDCFSAIDTNTEAQILQNLSEVMRGRTSVIISHRVSTVKNASHIIVLDAGEIMEEGSHEELMEKQGYYHMLYRKQLVEKELYESQKGEA